MKLLVIFNSFAQAGRSAGKASALQRAFSEHSIETEFLAPNAPGNATRLVAQACLADFDGVVAVGGDGTVFEVLNGLFTHPSDMRIPMGIVPMGTGNAFAREFDLYSDKWPVAISRMAKNNLRTVDVAHVMSDGDEYYFLNILGIGFATKAGMRSKKLKPLGNAAYTLGTLWETLKLKSYPLVIELDGLKIERENIMVEVCNSRYTGTSFLIAPGAEVDDGLLDVILLNDLSRLRLLKLFPTIYTGRHIEFDEIETFKASHIKILSPCSMLATVDGEFRGETPIEIQCLPKALELLI